MKVLVVCVFLATIVIMTTASDNNNNNNNGGNMNGYNGHWAWITHRVWNTGMNMMNGGNMVNMDDARPVPADDPNPYHVMGVMATPAEPVISGTVVVLVDDNAHHPEPPTNDIVVLVPDDSGAIVPNGHVIMDDHMTGDDSKVYYNQDL